MKLFRGGITISSVILWGAGVAVLYMGALGTMLVSNIATDSANAATLSGVTQDIAHIKAQQDAETVTSAQIKENIDLLLEKQGIKPK